MLFTHENLNHMTCSLISILASMMPIYMYFVIKGLSLNTHIYIHETTGLEFNF